ncbi:TIGR00730 family Rossman fold protein [Actinacidiphila glaucinigra]|uniref:LOG family protein n=1 Tax=Actinacidiphila glaucinigra TaxID=235986 RepID=UPI003D93344D
MRDLITASAPPALDTPFDPGRPLRFTVFCGSATGRHPAFEHAARTMGGLLAAAGIEIVYGGARIGLMGALADTALASGGHVTSVLPEVLNHADIVHPGLTHLEIVADMPARKARLCQLADAFLVLPGGLGTLEELAEMWSWAQLGLHTAPIALLNTASFFSPLLTFLTSAQQAGFLAIRDRDLVVVDGEPARLTTEVLAQLTPAEAKQC